jgi:hypothetical protein
MPKNLLFALLLVTGTAFATDCKQPLDQDTLNRLLLGVTDVELQPGASYQFKLFVFGPSAPPMPEDVPACATWKVEPEGKGATIDARGLLKIDPATTPGSKFVVSADVEHGRAQRQNSVIIWSEEAQPWVGMWSQQSILDCQAEKQAEPIRELEFRANGFFSVTWTPFEVYRDYWGSYAADNKSGTLSMKIEHGNRIPKDFQGAGKFKVKDKKTIELSGVYLDLPRSDASGQSNSTPPKSCRYVFSRM